MSKKRPLNINPLSIRLPIPALVSISHRVSGIIIFLFIPLLLNLFSQSLASEQAFADMMAWFQSPLSKLIIWVIAVGLFFHLLAGVRHLLMDLHLGESLKGGRMGAMAVFALSIVFAIWFGIALGGWV